MRLTTSMRDAFIRAAMDDVPSVDYQEEIRKLVMDDAISQLPESIKKIYKDPKTKDFVYTGYTHQMVTVYVPMEKNKEYVPSEKVKERLVEIKALEREQQNSRTELRQKLKGVAYGCNTRKQLLELLPEFEKYLPSELQVSTAHRVPAIVVVKDFVDAGWPKKK